MTKRQTASFILIILIGITFFGCDMMSTLFHGEKPPSIYTVTFNANGAAGTPPSELVVTSGTIIGLPGEDGMNKAGNVFVGWSDILSDSSIKYSAGASVTVTRNMLFYAQWFDESTPKYTVIFNVNGATAGTREYESKTVYSGISITVPGQGTLAYSGKTFGGWNTQANGGGINYETGAVYTVTKDIILYANWRSQVQYTVFYRANGASGAVPAEQKVDPRTEVTLQSAENLTYTDKRFICWNTLANGTGINYAEGASLIVTGNITLYAKWQDVYTVTFNANGAYGMPPFAQTADPGTVIFLPGIEGMNYPGKTFEGWNTKADCTGTDYAEGAPYVVSESSVLYAKWLSEPEEPPGATAADKLTYIRNNAGDRLVYDIVIKDNITMQPTVVATKGRNITVIIRSANTANVRTIQLGSAGNLFSVDSNITLILQDIVLKGTNDNNKALVLVGPRGKLVLKSGSKITSNNNSPTRGGGVNINGGVLEMNDGCEISDNIAGAGYGNSASVGGGIYVENKGTVLIYGGLISGNRARPNIFIGSGVGAGIFITGNSNVTMFGGEILKNSAESYGGGIFIDDSGSSFIKSIAPGAVTSGIIYGKTGDNANTPGAIYRNFGTKQRRDVTLGGYDEISSKTDEGWEKGD